MRCWALKYFAPLREKIREKSLSPFLNSRPMFNQIKATIKESERMMHGRIGFPQFLRTLRRPLRTGTNSSSDTNQIPHPHVLCVFGSRFIS
jgi:hypothetical protein